MYATVSSSSTHWFGARTVVAVTLLMAALAMVASAQDGCKIECYPNTKAINQKGGVGKSDNCRWILRTDGKPARLCDHIKCRKVCPQQDNRQQAKQDQQEAASENSHIEQQVESDSPIAPAAEQQPQGIMRRIHGDKLGKAPVPGVAGGRLNQPAQQPQQQAATGGRRMAPTLAPSVQYDENDTPPPIARFLDISPEE